MGYFFGITAWLATAAGLILTLVTTIPQVWDKQSIASWIWTSSGWIVALIFCVVLSVQRNRSDKKISEVNEKRNKLRVSHNKLMTRAKELKSAMQEAVAEKKATNRANIYLLDRLEQAEPKQPIKRLSKD